MNLTNREALEIAHAHGLTLRQFGGEIRANLEQARTTAHPTKTPARLFDGYMADVAHESGALSCELRHLHDNQ